MVSAVIIYDDGKVSIHDAATKTVGIKFPSGFYSATVDSTGAMKVQIEELKEFHNPYRTEENNLIMMAVEGFFNEGVVEKINSLGFIHKLGIMVYGKQGTGKTSMMHFIAKALCDQKDAIVLFCNNANELSTGIGLARLIREIQNNPIIFIADEFERYIKDSESALKNFLDGNMSINNTLFLASTNYIDKVPDTLKDRPSRFKVVQEIKGITNKVLIKGVLRDISNKISPQLFSEQEIEDISEKLDDVTLDELKHICLNRATETYIPKELLINKKTIGFKSSNVTEDLPFTATSKLFFTTPGLWGNKEVTIPNESSNI